MIAKASDFEYELATDDQIHVLADMDHDSLEKLLENAPVIKDDTTVLAIVEGIAYPLKALAEKQG